MEETKSMQKKQDKKVTFEKQIEWIVVAMVSNHNSFPIISKDTFLSISIFNIEKSKNLLQTSLSPKIGTNQKCRQTSKRKLENERGF